MLEISEIVIDSLHPAALARFWAAALTEYEVRAYDSTEVDRLEALGASIREVRLDHTVMLDPESNEFCV